MIEFMLNCEIMKLAISALSIWSLLPNCCVCAAMLGVFLVRGTINDDPFKSD